MIHPKDPPAESPIVLQSINDPTTIKGMSFLYRLKANQRKPNQLSDSLNSLLKETAQQLKGSELRGNLFSQIRYLL